MVNRLLHTRCVKKRCGEESHGADQASRARIAPLTSSYEINIWGKDGSPGPEIALVGGHAGPRFFWRRKSHTISILPVVYHSFRRKNIQTTEIEVV